ncbi:MAG: NACHT domain-containing protein [Snowella sp.]|nr:NACHT domain-containing protein [Snowella sp.]
MAKRSFRASPQGIAKAKQAFERKGWTQEYLASEAGLSSRQSVWKFFTGRPIERYIFQEICFRLDLNWEEIVEFASTAETDWVEESGGEIPANLAPVTLVNPVEKTNTLEILDSWVQALRRQLQERIKQQGNTLVKAFDLTQPDLSRIYTPLTHLRQPRRQGWLELSELEKNSSRNLLILARESVGLSWDLTLLAKPGAWLILGKVGSGKSVFLQYLALQCNQGNYQADKIPLLLELRQIPPSQLTENQGLIHYLERYFQDYSVAPAQIQVLLSAGRFFILLDGLDEVPLPQRELLISQLEDFVQRFPQNTLLVSCRSAVLQSPLHGFQIAEIADFSLTQVEQFAQQWFTAIAGDSSTGLRQAQRFLDQLQHPENIDLQEWSRSPLLLNLLCSVFREGENFPKKRTKLYQVGLELLLKNWDQAKGFERIEGLELSGSMSVFQTLTLFGEMAATTWEQGHYFFEKATILPVIDHYLQSLNENHTEEALPLNSEAIFQAIALEKGIIVEWARDIYGFSSITLQDYLTAYHLAHTPPPALDSALEKLAQDLGDPNRQTVILLTVNLLKDASHFLQQLKDQLDQQCQQSPGLSDSLKQIADKTARLGLAYQPAALRAYYFNLFHHRDLNLAIALDPQFSNQQTLAKDLRLDAALARVYTDGLTLQKKADLRKYFNFCFSLNLEPKFTLEPDFSANWNTLIHQLPAVELPPQTIIQWWQNQGKNWLETLRQLLIQYRHLGQDWQINNEQLQARYAYYQNTYFWVKCLQSDGAIAAEFRQNLAAQLLLPPDPSGFS